MSVLDSEDEIEDISREMVEVAKVQYVLFEIKNNSLKEKGHPTCISVSAWSLQGCIRYFRNKLGLLFCF